MFGSVRQAFLEHAEQSELHVGGKFFGRTRRLEFDRQLGSFAKRLDVLFEPYRELEVFAHHSHVAAQLVD